jgi:hypothetical protein
VSTASLRVVTRVVVVIALVIAVGAGAIFTNLALLNYGTSSDSPVGKLTPRADLPAAPTDVVRPLTGRVDEQSRGDDD